MGHLERQLQHQEGARVGVSLELRDNGLIKRTMSNCPARPVAKPCHLVVESPTSLEMVEEMHGLPGRNSGLKKEKKKSFHNIHYLSLPFLFGKQGVDKNTVIFLLQISF